MTLRQAEKIKWEQKELIIERLGEARWDRANFGWATNENSICTKLYPGFLNTTIDEKGKFHHEFVGRLQ